MLKTLDHYLFQRYLLTSMQIFIALYTMYVVIDGFTNFDNFQDTLQGASLPKFWGCFFAHYARQSALIFQLTAPTLAFLALVIVLVALRRGELYPVLSSGVPTIRLTMPIFWGVMVINSLVILNQECVLPHLGDQLQVIHGQDSHAMQKITPGYDRNLVYFSGEQLCPAEKQIEHATITLNFPAHVQEPTTLKARFARHVYLDDRDQTGWLLDEVVPAISEIRLTPEGRKLFGIHDGQLLLISDMTCDQLREGRETSRFLSTPQLAERTRHPSPSGAGQHQLIYELHSRLTLPLMNAGLLFVVLPLIIRRESNCLVTDICASVLVVGAIGLSGTICQFLCSHRMLSPDMAAWLPVITTGVTGCLFSSSLKT